MKKIIIRLDDICPDMNHDKFDRIAQLFLQYGVKPLIGVIPFNEDEGLKIYRKQGTILPDDTVWNELLRLHKNNGWDIALHGYQHKYVNEYGGLLRRNNKSEFVAQEESTQNMMINKGKRALQDRGFKITAFMAPAHAFDECTLKALKRNEIRYITDGFGVYPYVIYGNCVAFPVPLSFFRHLPMGIYTVCLHPNTMQEKDYSRLRNFLAKEEHNIISFSEAVRIIEDNGIRPSWSVINMVMEYAMRLVSLFVENIVRSLR